MGRGPSYPYVNLEDALNFSRKLYDYTKRGAAPVDSVIKDAWKYSPTSSSGQKVLAALKAFGLVEDAKVAGSAPALKLSQRAIHILLEEQDTPERREEIKKAALSPKWYEFCWKTWGKEMPPAMKSNLLIHHGFVDSTIDGFLRDYRKTVSFAGLLDDPITVPTVSTNGTKQLLQIGDYVQWESNGILRLPEPKKLIRIEDGFGFLDGSSTGIPVGELIWEEAPCVLGDSLPPPQTLAQPQFAHAAQQAPSKMQVETFALPEGVTGQLQWPSELSQDAFDDFVYQVEGLKRRVARAVKPKE